MNSIRFGFCRTYTHEPAFMCDGSGGTKHANDRRHQSRYEECAHPPFRTAVRRVWLHAARAGRRPQSSGTWRSYTVAEAGLGGAPHMMWAGDAPCTTVTHADARLTREPAGAGTAPGSCATFGENPGRHQAKLLSRQMTPCLARATFASVRHGSQGASISRPHFAEVCGIAIRLTSCPARGLRSAGRCRCCWPG